MKARRMTDKNPHFKDLYVRDAKGRAIENVVWFEPDTCRMGIAPVVSTETTREGLTFKNCEGAADLEGQTPIAELTLEGAALCHNITGHTLSRYELSGLLGPTPLSRRKKNAQLAFNRLTAQVAQTQLKERQLRAKMSKLSEMLLSTAR
jgi:hypothetical protein